MGSELKPGYEWAEVLVMVKTYPSPSAKHGETVCVAGARLDGLSAPEWIRLYPISFRALEDSAQFKKYQRIHVPIQRRGTYDPRPESYLPDVTAMSNLGSPVAAGGGTWSERRKLIDPLMGAVTMCELIRLNKAGTMADSIQSLGMVRPRSIEKVAIEEGAPWRPNQLEKVKRFSQADLLRPEGYPELQPVPFQLRVQYHCEDPACRGHNQHLIDWELGVMGLTWPSRYGSNTSTMIRGTYEKLLKLETKDVYLFVGNQHQRRATFSICGIWSSSQPKC